MRRKLLSRIGTVLVGLGGIAVGGLVAWNVFVQGPYGEDCRYSIGCRSFYCLSHELAGDAQLAADGHCTKDCESDDECGRDARCVVLGEPALDDLPPFGKPDKACMKIRVR